MTADPAPIRRPVRSFVLRAGRTTAGQQRALAELWPRWGLAFEPRPLDLDAVFGRRAARVLEIGFGDGELLCEMARAEPDSDFLGAEVHEPGVGHCLLLVERLGLTNVRLVRHDAVEVLREQIPAGALDAVNLFFPDPWPKKRHHKRRIVQPGFMRLVASRLKPGGRFHVATDWAAYAEHIAAVVAAEPAFEQPPVVPAARPRTRFERRGERLGHDVYERVWHRSTGPAG
ncbi:MAG: tRNA (guanosine(46)-N7)-methyltransferase TrmB [Gammaproteobacteria bacterium]|nr:tRNA (guanosine(46)-N7)-methyltransferase TrmB [Gammaproteobacteria bacterium]